MRALIIEDNENNMELITFILEKNGYKTICAETGGKGVDMAVKLNPDFILLDIQLPDISGTKVLSILKNSQTTNKIPVIAVTSYAMAGDRQRLLKAGCDGYIEKPIDPMQFIGQIKKVLGECS
ncbi:MAG: response regulator [Desulfobacula sp.]|nr:response regulator [Desulfobacula sp.]